MDKAYVLTYEVMINGEWRVDEIVGTYTNRDMLEQVVEDKVKQLTGAIPSYLDYEVIKDEESVVIMVKVGSYKHWAYLCFDIREMSLNQLHKEEAIKLILD